MEKIDKLIVYLFAIQAFAKDIHYSASGEAFYSKHLLADEIYKGIDEQIDALIETCILPYGSAKFITNYWQDVKQLPQYSFDFKGLSELVMATIKFIDKIEARTNGEQSLIDSIAQDLQHKLGLITRQVG